MDMRRRKGQRKEEGQSRIVIPTKPSALIIFGNEARLAGAEREKTMDEIPPPFSPSLPLSLPTILLRVRRISADMRTDECEIELRLRGARGRHGWGA